MIKKNKQEKLQNQNFLVNLENFYKNNHNKKEIQVVYRLLMIFKILLKIKNKKYKKLIILKMKINKHKKFLIKTKNYLMKLQNKDKHL